jgi:hypothetical protein
MVTFACLCSFPKALGLATHTRTRPETYDISPIDYGSHPMPIHSKPWPCSLLVSKSMKLKVLGLATHTRTPPGTYDIDSIDYGSHPMPIHSKPWPCSLLVSKSMKLKVPGLATHTRTPPGTYDIDSIDYGSDPMPIHSKPSCYSLCESYAIYPPTRLLPQCQALCCQLNQFEQLAVTCLRTSPFHLGRREMK